MTKRWEASDVSQLGNIAQEIIVAIAPLKMIVFYGEMGAGKTTLIKEMCLHLGVLENTSSPTFAIVNQYIGNEKIYHFDLFRLKSTEELLALGVEEYIDSNAYLFVEWPGLLIPLLEEGQFVSLNIETDTNQKRIITLTS